MSRIPAPSPSGSTMRKPIDPPRSEMTYANFLADMFANTKSRTELLAADLYGGCGGLALGFAAAGVSTVGFEMNPSACETYRFNLGTECHATVLTPGTALPGRYDLIIGGPPCQPFSSTGRRTGRNDFRNGLPLLLNRVESHKPKAVLIENVPTIKSEHSSYLAEVVSSLKSCGYAVETAVLNAADFGVPQTRRRLFIVAHRGGFQFPKPTRDHHWTVRQAIGRTMSRAPKTARILTESMNRYIANYERLCFCAKPRDLDPERPARTLTCRNLNGATSDMMRVKLPDGNRRMLTVREAARLQGFPDWFSFRGSLTSQFEQIGNAVPPPLAYAVAAELVRTLGCGAS